MRSAILTSALVIVLGTASVVWAGPFEQVPPNHWAYQACSRLTAAGIIPAPSAGDSFSSETPLTRFEFGIALLDPLRMLDQEMALLPAGADTSRRVNAAARGLSLAPQLSEDDVARLALDLRHLCAEFADVLRGLSFDTNRALSGLQALSDANAVKRWRGASLASPKASAALAPDRSSPGGDTVRLPLASGTVALTFQPDFRPPELLDYLAQSAADSNPAEAGLAAGAGPSPREPRVSRFRTAYEYGLTSALTLSLGYEEIARRGHGLSVLDAAYLASLDVGYRLTPSASVSLSYSLLEYSNFVFDTPKVRDRVAETAVSIEF